MNNKTRTLIRGHLLNAGLSPLGFSDDNTNGPDLWVTQGNKAYSVEIKVCRITKRNSVQVPPVEPNRREDDFICIVHPNGYCLIEPMKDHLKCCTTKGYRTLWGKK